MKQQAGRRRMSLNSYILAALDAQVAADEKSEEANRKGGEYRAGGLPAHRLHDGAGQ